MSDSSANPPTSIAKAIKVSAPERKPEVPQPAAPVEKKPGGVRPVEETFDVPAHMASMVGSRVGGPPDALGLRERSSLFEGPSEGIVKARATLNQMRSVLSHFLGAASAALAVTDAVVKAHETDSDLAAVMRLEGLDPAHLQEVMTRFNAFLDFVKPRKPEAAA